MDSERDRATQEERQSHIRGLHVLVGMGVWGWCIRSLDVLAAPCAFKVGEPQHDFAQHDSACSGESNTILCGRVGGVGQTLGSSPAFCAGLYPLPKVSLPPSLPPSLFLSPHLPL